MQYGIDVKLTDGQYNEDKKHDENNDADVQRPLDDLGRDVYQLTHLGLQVGSHVHLHNMGNTWTRAANSGFNNLSVRVFEMRFDPTKFGMYVTP